MNPIMGISGIYARDLVATSGRNDDSIALLDNSGCPIDNSIFPPLKKIARGKALMGKEGTHAHIHIHIQ